MSDFLRKVWPRYSRRRGRHVRHSRLLSQAGCPKDGATCRGAVSHRPAAPTVCAVLRPKLLAVCTRPLYTRSWDCLRCRICNKPLYNKHFSISPGTLPRDSSVPPGSAGVFPLPCQKENSWIPPRKKLEQALCNDNITNAANAMKAHQRFKYFRLLHYELFACVQPIHKSVDRPNVCVLGRQANTRI